jgi:hypothetical protein
MSKQPLNAEYKAIVTSVEHPEGLIKAQIRLLPQWKDVPVESLPWAEYKLPVGARVNEGDHSPVQVDDYVWVRFECGDTRFPVITGSCFYAPEEIPNLPHEVFQGDQMHEHSRTDEQPQPSAASKLDRISSQHGFLIEWTHEGAYRTTHKASGTAIEISKDGEIVLHCQGNGFQSTQGDQLNQVIGMFKHTVDDQYIMEVGNGLNITVSGNATFNVDGDFDVAQASMIKLLQGAGVVTGECVCAYTGSPHSDVSSKVIAAK